LKKRNNLLKEKVIEIKLLKEDIREKDSVISIEGAK